MLKTGLTWTALKTFLNTLTRKGESNHTLSKGTAPADLMAKQEPQKVAVAYGQRI